MLTNIFNVKVKVYEIESGINSNFQTKPLFQYKNLLFFQEKLYAKNIIIIINIYGDFFIILVAFFYFDSKQKPTFDHDAQFFGSNLFTLDCDLVRPISENHDRVGGGLPRHNRLVNKQTKNDSSTVKLHHGTQKNKHNSSQLLGITPSLFHGKKDNKNILT